MTGTRGVGVKLARLLGLMLRIDTLMGLSEEGVRHTSAASLGLLEGD